jgi:hypothetical protein
MTTEIFELPEHLDKTRSSEQPLAPAGKVCQEDSKEIQLEALEKSQVKSEEVKEVKVKRVRKVIDNETRELLIDKLKKSRKIKELTAESNELKEKLAKLETVKVEPVPIFKEEPKIKKTITRKVKNIEEVIKKKEEVSLKPLVEPVKVHLEVPKQPIIHSTWRRPIW